ncbi:MAG: hypothetical protein ACLUFP_01295 [Streptococcus salivarius]
MQDFVRHLLVLGLAEAMKKMAINDARRLEMVKLRVSVLRIYQYPQMIGQYRRLYEEVAV